MVCGALLGNCGTIVVQYSDNCCAVVAQVFLRARIVQSWTSQAASVVFATDFTYSTQGVAKLYPRCSQGVAKLGSLGRAWAERCWYGFRTWVMGTGGCLVKQQWLEPSRHLTRVKLFRGNAFQQFFALKAKRRSLALRQAKWQRRRGTSIFSAHVREKFFSGVRAKKRPRSGKQVWLQGHGF